MIDYNLLHLPSFSLVKWRRFFNLLKGVGFCRLSLSSWLIGGRSGGFCQSRVQTNLQPGDPPPRSRGRKPPASAAPPYLSHHVDLSSGDTRRISRPSSPRLVELTTADQLFYGHCPSVFASVHPPSPLPITILLFLSCLRRCLFAMKLYMYIYAKTKEIVHCFLPIQTNLH